MDFTFPRVSPALCRRRGGGQGPCVEGGGVQEHGALPVGTLSCLRSCLPACLGTTRLPAGHGLACPLVWQLTSAGAELPCKYPRFTRFMTSLAVKFATSSTEHRGTDRDRERDRSASSVAAGRAVGAGQPAAPEGHPHGDRWQPAPAAREASWSVAKWVPPCQTLGKAGGTWEGHSPGVAAQYCYLLLPAEGPRTPLESWHLLPHPPRKGGQHQGAGGAERD